MASVSTSTALLASLFVICVAARSNPPTTTRSYDSDAPGSNLIRVVESDTPKPNSRSWRGPFDDAEDHGKEKFSSAALRDFLDSYASKARPGDDPFENEGKSKKKFNVVHMKQHNNPYNDKSGWVSLEPVPWSLSKISKWHAKPKPVNVYSANDKSWENDSDYPDNDRQSSWKKPTQNSYYNPKPASSLHQYQVYYDNEEKPMQKPSYPIPSTQYSQTVRVQAVNQNRNPIKVNNYYNHDDCNHDDENVAIITDGQPANFPTDHYEGNRRIGTELRPEPHAFMGEGEWVLLSTTKGYKLPRTRQRSLDIKPESIGTHRSVRLTVLPPLKDSKVNMTTSHGGLLQVESTSETVEQAQRKFNKQNVKKPSKLKKRPMRELTASTIATIPRATGTDSSAVLAGVSAGILPATMAMLVPLAMNGKRRRRRREAPPPPTPRVEITLPRYF